MIVLAAFACAPAPVEWSAERIITESGDSALVLQPDGRLAPEPMAPRRAGMSLPVGPMCPGSLRTARHARIDLLPHQLEPAIAIPSCSRINSAKIVRRYLHRGVNSMPSNFSTA